jgi:hypothetical protein
LIKCKVVALADAHLLEQNFHDIGAGDVAVWTDLYLAELFKVTGVVARYAGEPEC